MSNYGWSVGGVGGGSASEPCQPAVLSAAPTGFQWTPCQYGGVPPDAVRAGVDRSGEPVYVGRAFHEGDILPAKIIQSHGGAYVPWGGGEHKKDYYEVLCAGVICWVPDSNGSIPPNAVAIGSTSDGEKLFVGRVLHDGALTPGKVQTSHGCCYIPYDGQELSFPEYEVLVIQP